MPQVPAKSTSRGILRAHVRRYPTHLTIVNKGVAPRTQARLAPRPAAPRAVAKTTSAPVVKLKPRDPDRVMSFAEFKREARKNPNVMEIIDSITHHEEDIWEALYDDLKNTRDLKEFDNYAASDWWYNFSINQFGGADSVRLTVHGNLADINDDKTREAWNRIDDVDELNYYVDPYDGKVLHHNASGFDGGIWSPAPGTAVFEFGTDSVDTFWPDDTLPEDALGARALKRWRALEKSNIPFIAANMNEGLRIIVPREHAKAARKLLNIS